MDSNNVADKIAQLLPYLDGVAGYAITHQFDPAQTIDLVKSAGNAYTMSRWGHHLFEWDEPSFGDRVRDELVKRAEGGGGAAPVGAPQAASTAPMTPEQPSAMPPSNPFDFRNDPAVIGMMNNVKAQLDKKRKEFQKQRDMTYAAAMQRTLPGPDEMGQGGQAGAGQPEGGAAAPTASPQPGSPAAPMA